MASNSVKTLEKDKKRKKDYLLGMEAEHVAQQICLWDQEVFRQLAASEFLGSAWMKEDKKSRAPNVSRTVLQDI